MASRLFRWLAPWLLIVLTGCERGCTAAKSHGAYTTLYKPGANPTVDVQKEFHVRQTTFGPTETPLAVVFGYGGVDLTFELDDLGDQKVLMSKEGHPGMGMVLFQPLYIRKTGDYKVRILANGREMSSYTFSVQRTPAISDDRIDNGRHVLGLKTDAEANDLAACLDGASVCIRDKEWDKAIAGCNKAIEQGPSYVQAYALRAALYYSLTNLDDALADLNEYICLKPGDPYGFYNRAHVFSRKGEFDKAIRDYQRAERLFPKNLTGGENGPPRKIIIFDNPVTNVRLGSSYLLICNDFAWLLATCPNANLRDGKKSVELSTKMCKATAWKWFPCLDTLAAGYAETGDFDSAVKYENLALQLVDTNSTRVQIFQQRLSLYEKHIDYHQPQAAHIVSEFEN